MRELNTSGNSSKKNMQGMIFFNTKSIFYLTGFHHIPTERPIALVLPTEGELSLFVPYLEVNHVKDKCSTSK